MSRSGEEGVMSFGVSRYVGSLSLLGLGISLVYVLQRGFAPFIRGYLDYVTMVEYSYLFVLAPISVALAIYLVITGFHPSKPSFPNLMASASLFLGALFFYILGGLDEVNSVQLFGVSFVLLAVSLLLLLLRPSSLKHFVAVLLLLVITVPVPLGVINYSSTFFSHLIGRVVAAVMGAEVIESGSSFFISVYDAEGTRRVFELVHACSGIVSITSILATSPLIVYVVMRSPGPLVKRVVKALAIVGVAVGIVFAGNAARVAAVLYYTQHYSYEQALEIFHQYPSFLYSVLAIAAAFYLLGKFVPSASNGTTGPGDRLPRLSGRGRRAVASALAVVAFLAFGLASLAPAISLHAATVGPQPLTTLDTLVSSPAEVIFNGTGVEVVDDRPVPALTALLGSSSVNLVVLRYNGTTYSGYIEVGESPARFHGWHVCLTLQGYTILRAWKDVAGDLIINYLLFRRGGEERLLGYAIYTVPFLVSNGTASAYVRVSLFVSVRGERDVEAGAAALKRLLVQPLSAEGGGAAATLDRILLLRDVLLVANLVVISALILDALARVLRFKR